jgi:hypothetical protein
MPINTKGQRISVAQYDRNDGFSPGSAMIVHVPGLDNAKAFARTGAVELLNMRRAFARNAPIVVIDEATGRRQLIYTELDANAPTPQTTNLMIVPGKAFADAHTYVVAVRNLRNARGRVIAAPAWFEKLRDNRQLPRDERSQRPRHAGAAEARTIGASVYEPALDPVRSRDRHMFYGLPAIRHFPFAGSAIEIWDSGAGRVQPPPVANIPPTAAPNNIDPHEDPRRTPAAQLQISDYLEPNGSVQNVCAGQPCHSFDYTP